MASRLKVWVVLAVVALGGSAQANKERAREAFKKGMACYTLDDFDCAIRFFELGFREEPDPVFLYNIAQAHRLARRPTRALDFYRKYLKLVPDAPNAREVEEQMAALEKTIANSSDPLAPGGNPPAATAPATRPAATAPATRPAPAATPPPVAARATPATAQPTTTGQPTTTARPTTTTTRPGAEPQPPRAPRRTPDLDPARAAAAVASPSAPPPAPRDEAPRPRRWPLWVGITAGVLAVAGGAVVAGVYLSRSNVSTLPDEVVP